MTVPDRPAVSDVAALPPVVVVVVARDPGDWFEQCLRSVGAQTYANLSVLVVDAASATSLAPRVAVVLPDAHERRREVDDGFGAACNEVLDTVQGAAFYLFCHDDVRLEPDVVQVMVEEAFRANAGVVGPKLVQWDDPKRLAAMAVGVDKFGAAAPTVDAGELDQSQHDANRDAFAVSSAAVLVRADLFAALGGFDTGIAYDGDDVDLCWRARVAGASVVVATGARVEHLVSTVERGAGGRDRRLRTRHQLRILLTAYGPAHLARVLPQALALAVVQVVHALVTGRLSRAGDIIGAWWWNLRRIGDVRDRRRRLAAVRTVPDAEVRSLQTRGSVEAALWLRRRLDASQDRIPTSLGRSSATWSVVAWAFVLLVMVVGSRRLLTDRLPAVGDFAAFPDGVDAMLAGWLDGYRQIGVGVRAPGPPALGLFAAVTTVLSGHAAAARTLLVLAALPVGALGAWRLATPIGSRRARIAALTVFSANPLMYNALAQGRWGAMVLVGLCPWMLLHLARASGVEPYDTPERPLLHHVLGLGLVLAVAGLWAPVAPLVVAAVAVSVVLGGILVGQVAGAGRILVTSVAASGVAVVLLAPWSLSLAGAPADVLLGASLGDAPDLSAGELLRFQTGPVGASGIGWALLVGSTLALLIGRSWRLAWSARAWVTAMVSWGGVIAVDQGWLPSSLAVPVPEVALAPAVAALSLAAAMGVAAFEADLSDYHFGWRQFVSFVAAGAVCVAVLPVLASAAGGRWDTPRRDVGETLAFGEQEAADGGFRVLWIGDPDVVPVAGWTLPSTGLERPGQRLVAATSDGGAPTIEDLWLAEPGAGTTQILDAIASAADGGTNRLGSLLAPMGVRYLVVPDRLGPGDEGVPRGSSVALVDLLTRQLDLSLVPTGGGLRLFRNAAWTPVRSQEADGVVGVLGGQQPEPVRGPVLEGTVRVAQQNDGGWSLDVDGVAAPRRADGDGAMAFDVAEGGDAVLSYDAPIGRRAAAAGPVLAWVLVLVLLLRNRAAGGAEEPTAKGDDT